MKNLKIFAFCIIFLFISCSFAPFVYAIKDKVSDRIEVTIDHYERNKILKQYSIPLTRQQVQEVDIRLLAK